MKRTIGLLTATGIVVANMIGSGVFITSGIIAGMLPNSMWVIACWIFGGFLALTGSLCYSELATRMPVEGGEYAYLHKLYHPVVGFLSGWTSFIVGFSAPIAGSAIGFSEYLYSGMDISTNMDPTVLLLLKKVTSVFIVLLFTVIHYHGIKRGASIQNLLVFFKIILILSIILIGFSFGSTDLGNLALSFNPGEGASGFSYGTAMMLVMFSYSGWNASAYIAGEIKNPEKNISRSLIIGTFIVFSLYIGLNVFFLSSIPYKSIGDEIAIGEAAVTTVLGVSAGKIVSVIISIMLLSSISAFVMIGPRIYYAMAMDDLFFSFAKKIHPKYNVPSRSIAIQGVLAVIFVVFSSIEQLLVYLYYALNVFPFLAVIGLFIARKRNINSGSYYKVPGYPVIPVIFLVCTLYLAIIAFINRPVESSAAIITILIGIPLYYLWARFKK